ncbi:MAG: hypothetical protein RIR97_132 [Pseudomonadota bacterium]
MTLYTITLKNCAFFARHGVHDEEEFLGQRFFVDAELDVNGGEALENDDIGETVDYGVAFTVIEKIITGKRRISRARITVRKPNAPVPGVLDHVQVSIEHFA